jgi:acyl dehydratase
MSSTTTVERIPAHGVGDRLPELSVHLDRTAIVAAAIASQDFEDVHHDPGLAQQRGMRDVFISINSTNGYIDRYVTDWAGPTARIRSVSLRLGVPHFGGDTLRFEGEVTDLTDGVTTLRIVGRNDNGVHVTSDVTLIEHEGTLA